MKTQSNADMLVMGLVLRLNKLDNQLKVLELKDDVDLEEVLTVKCEFDRLEQLLNLLVS